MSKAQKILLKILSGTNDLNIDISDIFFILKFLGFDERIKESYGVHWKII